MSTYEYFGHQLELVVHILARKERPSDRHFRKDAADRPAQRQKPARPMQANRYKVRTHARPPARPPARTHAHARTRAMPSRAEPSRAEPSRAEPSRAEPSRAEPSQPGLVGLSTEAAVGGKGRSGAAGQERFGYCGRAGGRKAHLLGYSKYSHWGGRAGGRRTYWGTLSTHTGAGGRAEGSSCGAQPQAE